MGDVRRRLGALAAAAALGVAGFAAPAAAQEPEEWVSDGGVRGQDVWAERYYQPDRERNSRIEFDSAAQRVTIANSANAEATYRVEVDGKHAASAALDNGEQQELALNTGAGLDVTVQTCVQDRGCAEQAGGTT